MSEIRICNNCGFHNAVANLECEMCGFDISFCIPVDKDEVKEQEKIIQKYFLQSIDGEIKIPIGEETLIGRDGVFAEYFEKSKYISRYHAKLYFDGNDISLMDASTNGTFVNGKRLEKMKKMVLQKGDKITFADMDFILEG